MLVKDNNKEVTNFIANKDKKPTLNEEGLSKAEKRRRLKEKKKQAKKAIEERESNREKAAAKKKDRFDEFLDKRELNDEDIQMNTDEESDLPSPFIKTKMKTKEKTEETDKKDSEKSKSEKTESKDEENGQQDKDKDDKNKNMNDKDNYRPNKRSRTCAEYLPERMSYREAVLNGYTICEIRSDNGTKLEQKDYNYLADKLSDLLCEIERVKDDWRIGPSGLSMGAVWYACETKATINSIKVITPKIESIEGKYKYLAFGPGEQPFVYPRLRLPAKPWANKTSEELENRLRRCNEELDKEIVLPDGTKIKRVFKVIGKARDGRDKWTDDGELVGMFSVTLQMDEILVEELKLMCGILQLGPHKCFIEGKEGEKLVETIEQEKEERQLRRAQEIAEREEREANTREGLRAKGGDGEMEVGGDILK